MIPGWAAMVGATARVWVPAALAISAAQTLLVVSDPVPTTSPLFVGAAVLSGAVFAIGLAIVARALSLDFASKPVRWREVVRLHPALWWAAVSVVLSVLLALLSPYLTVVGLVVGLLVMPPAATGHANALAAGLATVRRSPGRFVLHTVVVILVWILAAVGMLLLGFLITGPGSVAATWLVLSFVGVVVLASWTALFVRTREIVTSSA